MKHNTLVYITAVSGILFFSSCTHYYYIPNAQNVPMLKEKNELHLAGALGTGDEIATTEFMGAYAVTENIGVTANFLSAKAGDATNGGKGTYGEAAFGYYKPLSAWCVFETYAGYGMGIQHHDFENNGASADLSFNKFFVQPAIGVTTHAFDLIFAVRGSQVEFTKIVGQQVPFSAPSSFLLLEPSATIRAGWKNIKLQLQLVTSDNTGEFDFPREKFNLNLGLYFTFANRFKKAQGI